MGISHVHSESSAKKNIYRSSWFQLLRPMTFSGTISPIIAGTAIAALSGPIRMDVFIVLIIAALFVQISANMFNDYFDFKHGQDQEKWEETKFNSLAKPMHHHVPIAAVCIIIAISLGIWLSMETTWWLAIIGSIGILAGLGYSAGNYSFSALGLGETVAAIFLGFVTTFLGFIVQGNIINSEIVLVAMTYAMLISTMILTNNIRDLVKDQEFRHTVAMRLGKKRAIRLLGAILLVIYSWAFLLITAGVVPFTASFAVFALPVAIRLYYCFRPDASRADEISAMGWAGKHHWTFGLLFAVGIWLGA